MEKEKALFRIKASRQELLKAIDELSEWERCNIQVEGIWTVKDIVGHISAWEMSLNSPLAGFLLTGQFAPESIPDHDAWNLRQASLREGKSFAEVLAEAEDSRQELLRLAESVEPAQWEMLLPAPWGGQETLSQMLDGLAWHEEEHVKSITTKRNN